MEITIVNKDSFRDWKANPVTKAIMVVLNDRVLGLQDELGSMAGIDSLNDRFKVGAINAYKDLLNISVDEVSDGD